MNLALALAFLAAGGILLYSGFKDLTIAETMDAINSRRKGVKVNLKTSKKIAENIPDLGAPLSAH